MSQAKAEALGGYTPTQALIKHFTDTGIKHFVRQLSGHVTALNWTYPWCEKAWKRFPDVLSLDNTYKTNRFDMPFLNVTGVTNLHTTFNVAFAIVNKEDEEAYTWLIEHLEKLRVAVGAQLPTVAITDFEKALKNALATV